MEKIQLNNQPFYQDKISRELPDLWHKKNRFFYEREREKTSEERESIKRIIEIIQEEQANLGVSVSSLKESCFHIFQSDNHRNSGKYDLETNTIWIAGNSSTIIKKIAIHEGIHAASYKDGEIHLGSRSQVLHFTPQRVGYRGGSSREMLRGFNEMVTEKMTQELVATHEKDLNMNHAEIVAFNKKSYPKHLAILDIIIGNFTTTGSTPSDIWTKMKRGLFTEQIFFLREIEKKYGKGSLRVLASMDSCSNVDLQPDIFNQSEIYQAIYDFFITTNQQERERLARKILDPHWYEKYENQNKKTE